MEQAIASSGPISRKIAQFNNERALAQIEDAATSSLTTALDEWFSDNPGRIPVGLKLNPNLSSLVLLCAFPPHTSPDTPCSPATLVDRLKKYGLPISLESVELELRALTYCGILSIVNERAVILRGPDGEMDPSTKGILSQIQDIRAELEQKLDKPKDSKENNAPTSSFVLAEECLPSTLDRNVARHVRKTSAMLADVSERLMYFMSNIGNLLPELRKAARIGVAKSAAEVLQTGCMPDFETVVSRSTLHAEELARNQGEQPPPPEKIERAVLKLFADNWQTHKKTLLQDLFAVRSGFTTVRDALQPSLHFKAITPELAKEIETSITEPLKNFDAAIKAKGDEEFLWALENIASSTCHERFLSMAARYEAGLLNLAN